MSGIVTPTVIGAVNLNYLWPQYSLPWNNFFGRIKANPFYLSNELRNLTIREINSPLTYDSHANATWVANGTNTPNWTAFVTRTSKPTSEKATKVFVGRYIDQASGIRGLEYQYDLKGVQVFINDSISPTAPGVLVVSVNLANQSLTQNLPVYTDTAVCDPCNNIKQTSSMNRCEVGDSQNFFSNLLGLVTLNGQQLPIVNPVPYTNSCNQCPSYTSSNITYAILGNKLYLAIPVATLTTTNDLRTVTYDISLRVVEVAPADGLGLIGDTASGIPPFYPSSSL